MAFLNHISVIPHEAKAADPVGASVGRGPNRKCKLSLLGPASARRCRLCGMTNINIGGNT